MNTHPIKSKMDEDGEKLRPEPEIAAKADPIYIGCDCETEATPNLLLGKQTISAGAELSPWQSCLRGYSSLWVWFKMTPW